MSNDQQVRVRPVTQADLAAVQEVLVATWHATYDAILGREQVDAITTAWRSIEALERQRAAEEYYFVVAEIDGRLVATASARPGSDGRVTLKRLYVLPEAQGRGIGRRLLAATLASFPQARAVRLEVEQRNVRAIAFYERAGFRVVGEGDHCGGFRIRHVVMEKPLA